MDMTARERVMAVINGKSADRTPVMFTMHFPADCQFGDAAVKAHLDFFRESQGDIGKVMNENLLRSDITARRAGDLSGERINLATKKGLDAQVDLVKRIVDQAGGERMILATIHGPMVSVHHMSGRKGFFVENLEFYRTCKEEDPQALRTALQYASDALCLLVRRCIEEAWADGIYFAALGAERTLFTREEYADIVRPFDNAVLNASRSAGGLNLLHICKKGVDVQRFVDYPVEIFNWEMTGTNPSLEEALRLIPEDRTILGGFSNESGPLIQGTEAEIRAETSRLLEQVHGRRWILGAGCTLPTGIDCAKLRAVVSASKAFGKVYKD